MADTVLDMLNKINLFTCDHATFGDVLPKMLRIDPSERATTDSLMLEKVFDTRTF